MPKGKSDNTPPRTIVMSGFPGSRFDPAVDRLVDTKEAARILDISPNTLAKARVYGGAHAYPYLKMGASVRYSTRTLAEHLESKVATRTCQTWTA